MDATNMESNLRQVLTTGEQIGQCLDKIAAQVDANYVGHDPLPAGVLKGAVYVMAGLSRRLHVSAPMDWMTVSSYGSGTKSSDVVRIFKDLDTDVTDQRTLIVEDAIGSGLTLSWLVGNLSPCGMVSVEIVTPLRKPNAAKVEVDAKYVGSDIPTEFAVGYGLDYTEWYRSLSFISTLCPEVYGSWLTQVNLDATWGSDGKMTGYGAWTLPSDGGQGASELRSSPFLRWSKSRTLR